MNKYDVSIIIVNWNTKQILKDCLQSVYEQTQEVEFEVIVIDNASSDDSVEMIRSEFPEVNLIENTENRGFAAANNQGMEVSKGKYVLLLNSDTVVLDGAIQKTIAFAEQHPEAAVIGCRVLNSDRTLQPTCFMYPSLLNLVLSSTYLYKLFPRNRFFGREQMKWWDRNDVRQVQVVTGCYMLVRKEVIDQVGVMDDGYFMYGEETDWCYRFHKAGWKLLFTPDAQIIHLGGASSSKIRPQMLIQLRISILYFIKKHYSYLYYLLAKMLVIFWFGIRIPWWSLMSFVSKKHAEESKILTNCYIKAIHVLFRKGSVK